VSPLRDVFRQPLARNELAEDELRDPKLIFHMLDTLREERSRRRDPRWNPGEQKLEEMTIERLVRERRERGRR
jgi:hypothetical protein